MRFELNEGQTDSRVKFMARGAGSTLFLTNTDAVLALARPRPDRTAHKTSGLQPRTTPSMLPALHDALPRPMVESAVRLRFVGANSHAQVIGLDRLPGVSNYFIGKDRRMWRTNVPSYARVEYRDLYPGIDLVYYGNQGHLEYDLVVKPGATPGMIKLAIAGAAQPRLDARGNLLLSLHGNVVRQALPVAYQQEGRSVRRAIRTRYTLLGRHTVGSFDRRKPLTIDPVLSYSTYLGGTGGDGGGGIAVDATGDAYVTGSTSSSDFPTTPGALETTYHGSSISFGSGDVFVTKLNATGSALVYSTYLGGGKEDDSGGIAVDAMGDVYVTGHTYSSNFPTTPGAFAPTFGRSSSDAFVTKLNATGSALVYSTYLSGSDGNESYGGGIAVDATGDAYVTGSTSSSDFPTTPGALETTYHGGYLSFGGGDAFVTKLNATGSALVYSTYLGGGKEDDGHGIAVDAMGDAYITGSTDSSDFPTTPGAFETTDPGGVSFTTFTAFVTKFDVRDTTGANGSLANEISRLRIETDGLLTGNNGLAVAAGNAASDGDALAAASTTDKAKLLANVLSDLQGAISPAAEAKAGLSSGEDVADLSVPGAEKGALSHITAFIQQSDSNKALFNL